MSPPADPPAFDVFLSHASPDKPWGLQLAAELTILGLRVFLGQHLVFVVERDADGLRVTDPSGRVRNVPAPWRETALTVARLGFARLTREPLTDANRGELAGHAATLGRLLFDVLFDE